MTPARPGASRYCPTSRSSPSSAPPPSARPRWPRSSRSALGGEIVSADSMQVYRGMDIGTAKPAVAERRVPLPLPRPRRSRRAVLRRALPARCARRDRGHPRARAGCRSSCGGTGLYVRAALDDMRFPAGEPSRHPRAVATRRSRPSGAAAASTRLLAARDPASAALIHPNNVRRTIRALEMLEEDGPPTPSRPPGSARARASTARRSSASRWIARRALRAHRRPRRRACSPRVCWTRCACCSTPDTATR